MLSSIRKFSKSILGKIVIGLIAVAFVVGFGMGGSFTGKQNIVAKINDEKITSQEFVTYLQKVNITTEDIEKIGKSNLLQRILMNYISEKIISMESKKRGFQLSDRSLFNKLKADKKFQKDGKFSEIKYEKFMISNNLTKPFYENIVRETEVKDQLLNFYSGGIKLPVFIINDLYKKENILKKINYINLTKIYEKNEISESEIKDYYDKNKNSFQDIYKKFKYLKLLPEILVSRKILNEEFFKRVNPELDSEETLRNDVEKKIKENFEERSKTAYERDLADALIEKVDPSFAPSMVENYLTNLVEDVKKQNKGEPMDEAKVREHYTPVAERNMKWYLIRNKLIENQGFEVSIEKIENEIQRLVERTPQSENEIRKFYKKPSNRKHLEDDLMEKIILEYLEQFAKVKEVDVSTKDLRGKEHAH